MVYINTKSTGGSSSLCCENCCNFFTSTFPNVLISNARDKVASNSESSRISLVGFIPVEFYTVMENVARKVLRKYSVRGKFYIFSIVSKEAELALISYYVCLKLLFTGCLQVVFINYVANIKLFFFSNFKEFGTFFASILCKFNLLRGIHIF